MRPRHDAGGAWSVSDLSSQRQCRGC